MSKRAHHLRKETLRLATIMRCYEAEFGLDREQMVELSEADNDMRWGLRDYMMIHGLLEQR